jgi:predicted RNA-binding Zn-ribbon protein involved in translation (DUF1610 family)
LILEGEIVTIPAEGIPDNGGDDTFESTELGASPTPEPDPVSPDPSPISASVDGTEEVIQTPVRVCPRCSVQSKTAGNFCPNCGASYIARAGWLRSHKRIVLILAGLLVLAGAGTGIVLGVQHADQVKAEQAAADEVKKKESDAAAEAKKRESDAAQAAASAAAAKQAADAAKRMVRKTIVTALEDSVLKDAQSRVTEGVLTGPITLASCTALGGGSTDDLTAITGTFQCIAVNKTNADGSQSGYRFSATVNWDDASYTWHLGS